MPTREIQLPDNLVEAVHEQAGREGTTLEELVASCVEEHLNVTGEAFPRDSDTSRGEIQKEGGKNDLFSISFIRGLSHEVRTAVTSILGFTEILETEVAISQQEFIAIIRSGGERLLQIIDAVVYLAHLEDGSITFDPEPLDIALQLRGLAEDYEEKAWKKGVRLVVEEPSAQLYLSIDPDVFGRIVHALVDNAVKFTDEGKVAVQTGEERGELVLKVRDTGCGIDEADGAEMFEPFSQRGARGKERVAGSGLGLTVTQKLVDYLGGRIEWQSTPGKGTAFTVRFPAHMLRSSSPDPAPKRSRQWGFDQLPLDQSVLLVEDDPTICQLVPVMLPVSYTIDVLTETTEALERAKSRRYDIVLMDINLGDRIDGVELMRRMRGLDGYEDVLFIAVTAYGETHEGETFHEKGFDGYVGKPFSKKALYENLIQV